MKNQEDVYSEKKGNVFTRFFDRVFNRDKVRQLENRVANLNGNIEQNNSHYKEVLEIRDKELTMTNKKLIDMAKNYLKNNFLDKDKSNIYNNLHNTLDNEGWIMLNVVKRLIPCDFDSEFHVEDNMGIFNEANGNDLKKYYEIVAFSERQYEQIGAYERMSSYSDYSQNPEYLKYKDKLIDETIKEIIKKHPIEAMDTLIKAVESKQNISNLNNLIKNDIKVTVLEVENKNVEDYFKEGQVMSLQEANEKFKKIERSPQLMIENSKKLGLNHPYTKVGFKIELHDGDSFNARYSFGTGENESLIDCISSNNNEYLNENEKAFFKDFKNESLLVELVDNFKSYLYDLDLEGEDKLNAIYDKFDKDYSIRDELKKNPNFDLNEYHETMVETIADIIQHKPIESIKILEEYIPNTLNSETNVKIGKVDGLAKEYFTENENMSLLEANKRFKKADMEIASIINSSEDIGYQTVGFTIDAQKTEQMSSAYAMGSMQRNDLIDLVEKCEYGEKSSFLSEFYDKKLVKAFENCKEISAEYLEHEYELDFWNNKCSNSVVLTNDNKLMYVDRKNKFGELETFNLVDKNNNVASYELKKEDSGLSKDCSIDFSKKHLLNVNDAKSQIKSLDKNISQKISLVKKALDSSNLIKEVKLNAPTINQNHVLNNSAGLSM